MSDKKNLLNESQIRQFMKLASLTPLTPGFVKGLTERTAEEIEESHGSGVGERGTGAADKDSIARRSIQTEEAPVGELDLDAADDLEGGSPEEDAEADVDIEKADDEMGLDAAEPEGRMISVDDFLGALESALEGVMGDEVEIDSDEMADEEPAIEDEEAVDLDMGAADVDMDMAVDDEEMALEETTKGEKTKRGTDAFRGMKQGEKSEKDPGEEDFTTKKGEKIKAGPHKGQKAFKGPSKGELDKPEKGPKAKSPGYRPKAFGQKASTNESADATDDIVEAVTKRVAARILKSALAKK